MLMSYGIESRMEEGRRNGMKPFHHGRYSASGEFGGVNSFILLPNRPPELGIFSAIFPCTSQFRYFVSLTKS